MAFSTGRNSICLEEILNKVDEATIAAKYLGITEVPCVINSPLRDDKRPSFGIYTFDGTKIRYTDFATGERGGLFDLLSYLWNLPYDKVVDKVEKDFLNITDNKEYISKVSNGSTKVIIKDKSHSKIDIKVREWRKYDIEYWESYGVSLEWLKYANVYPISHKFITKENKKYVFGADKYAYAFIEKKEGNISIKIYQPFNKIGFKWCTSTDSSVISLWTKVPQEGDRICICSSLKDALCLWSNTGIPCLAPQGEGYNMSNTAVMELKRRFKEVYILFDNDTAGLIDGAKLSEQTGFTNIILPRYNNCKDVSDLYHNLQDKNKFREIILNLFNKN